MSLTQEHTPANNYRALNHKTALHQVKQVFIKIKIFKG
ncbi:hypothetical protein H359_0396 [Chlamydia ibidis 10-1398/6]|uniref:Uncharacterized protein n=1 Tax=Chlamydia ibidis 10-1398/6 TaxID=1046581 RepID=A0ABP2XFV6_9CHLA|nr:hypothetical protein H359_0396 [Chlamydia ibidis 10-1398/6]